MPFELAFWRKLRSDENTTSWSGKAHPPTFFPKNILGFIVSFPILCGKNENNNSEMNLTLLALINAPGDDRIASVDIAGGGDS